MKILHGFLLASLLCSFPVRCLAAQEKEKPASPEPVVQEKQAGRFRLGGFHLGASYSYVARPYYYFYRQPWYFDRFLYNDYFWHPYPLAYHPGWYTGFSPQAGMGDVKLSTNLKDADVFIDSAYAGKAGDLKSIWIEPGAYNLKLEAKGYEPFAVRVYVLSGKTLKVDATLHPVEEKKP